MWSVLAFCLLVSTLQKGFRKAKTCLTTRLESFPLTETLIESHNGGNVAVPGSPSKVFQSFKCGQGCPLVLFMRGYEEYPCSGFCIFQYMPLCHTLKGSLSSVYAKISKLERPCTLGPIISSFCTSTMWWQVLENKILFCNPGDIASVDLDRLVDF